MKISILLPYKENYSAKSAGAVSLFVKDTALVSKYKNHIQVFGSTKDKLYLSKNYINLRHNKSLFKSANKEYVKKFLNDKNFLNTDLLEVHNRPSYIKQIKKNYK